MGGMIMEGMGGSKELKDNMVTQGIMEALEESMHFRMKDSMREGTIMEGMEDSMEGMIKEDSMVIGDSMVMAGKMIAESSMAGIIMEDMNSMVTEDSMEGTIRQDSMEGTIVEESKEVWKTHGSSCLLASMKGMIMGSRMGDDVRITMDHMFYIETEQLPPHGCSVQISGIMLLRAPTHIKSKGSSPRHGRFEKGCFAAGRVLGGSGVSLRIY
jgi:hypothetical protein